jgi:hypothetical protein
MSTMPFVDIIDKQRAIEYVRDQLSRGTALAKLLARSIDLSRGRCRVAMPEAKDQGEGFDLRWETFRLVGDEETIFARLIKSFISNEECHIILQDANTSVSFPYFAKRTYRRLARLYAGEVYWCADTTQANLSDDEMNTLINHASFWPFSAFFYTDGISDTKAELDDADFQLIVKGLVGIAVGAFDDRSYLVWWRDDVRPFPVRLPNQ